MHSYISYRRIVFMVVISAAAILLSVTSVFSQSGGSLGVRQSVIAGGGNTSVGGNLQLSGTAGQPAAGTPMSGGTLAHVSGFWPEAANSAPTAISLSSSSVSEGLVSGTTVGNLSTTDANAGNTFTYLLVSGAGSDDNGSFTIDGNQLRTAAVFDFETKSSYSIRVRSQDQGGLSIENQFTITVTNLNESPTNIALSQANVAPHSPLGTTVGFLSSTDPDASNSFSYILVSGQGSADNSWFAISGNELKTAAVFDSAGKSSYSIRVRTTDQGGLFYEQPFTISVTAGGTIQFSSASYTVAENAGAATITITRTGGSAGTATVFLTTSNGTAQAGDYTPVSQTLTFADGETSKSVSIPIADDSTSETDETINLTLSQIAGTADLGTLSMAVLTIKDDDAPGGIISFSQANYSVAETGPGSISITVIRTGDVSRPVTVDYATPDDSDSPTAVPCSAINGLATSRCDFTTALGTLKFAAGETTKTFTVLISQDNYVEGPETLTLTLSNLTGGAVFGTSSTAVLTITDDPSEPETSPADDAANFVRQHYHDFLNREPDDPGLAFWTSQITDCTPAPQCIEVRRINVSAAFFLSIEFQETGYLVERFYKTAYGDGLGTSTLGGAHQLAMPVVRVADFLLDTQQIGSGIVVGQNGWQAALENNKQTYAADFVSRSRFAAAFPSSMTAAQFVDQLNTNAGNPLSLTERDELVNDLSTGAKTRAQVLRAVAEDPDLKAAEFNRAFVLMQYFGYLRRHPNSAPDGDYTGYDFWLTKLNQFNGNYIDAEMVRAFIESIEYRQRFGH